MKIIERETLEAEALKNICACYYYDLADNIDEASSTELADIIADSQHAHILQSEERSDCVELQEQQRMDQRKEQPTQ